MNEPFNHDIEMDSAKKFLRNEALRKTVPTIPGAPIVLLAFFLGKDLWFLLFIPIAWMYFLQRSHDVVFLDRLSPGFQKNYRALLVVITMFCLGAPVSFIFFILMFVCLLVYGIYFDSMFDGLQKKYGVEPDELSKYK